MIGLTISVVVVLIACLLLYVGHRYQGLIELGKNTVNRYNALEAEYPFTKPSPNETISTERWRAMLAIRERLADRITPSMENLVDQFNGNNPPEGVGGVLKLMALVDDFKAMTDEHLTALEESAMGPGEYCWLLGLAVNGALNDDTNSQAGQAYLQILDQVQKLTQQAGDSHDDINADKLIGDINKLYAGRTPDKSWVVDNLEGDHQALYLLDLLTLALGERTHTLR